MNNEEIKNLITKSENAAVEFKRARGGVPADFWPSYSSFANTDGGIIILGVRENDGKHEIEGLANTETFFSLVRIGERSGMGLSSLYGTWEKEHFATPSIVESYEPDRTKVMVEFEANDSELGEKTPEVGGELRNWGWKSPKWG
ncbi:MAG: putative DNA binding domain-containing protein [Kiritimatiellae bacterium]|nr:putative DNA binding domain-containing protein [Kiritimatiellia bacterium]